MQRHSIYPHFQGTAPFTLSAYLTWILVLSWVLGAILLIDGNALDMPFEDGEFQLVVSSFVFHEVGIPDRTQLFREAVRVLASGCMFMILDQFNSLDRAYKVGNVSELLAKIEKLGVEDVEHRSLKEAGVRLGGASHFRRIAYVSGRKVGNPEASGKQ
jgi:hypothetical protein